MKRNLRKFSAFAPAFMMLVAFLLVITSAPVFGQAEDVASGVPVNGALTDSAPKAGGIELLIADTKGAAQVSVNSATGVASFISLPDHAALSLTRGGSAEAEAAAFFAKYGDAFGISEAGSQLTLAKSQTDDLGMTHLTYDQVQDGVSVLGGQIKVHLIKGNRITAVNGVFVPHIKVGSTPRLTADKAGEFAVGAVARQQGVGLEASFSASQLQAVNTALYFYNTGILQGVAGNTVLVFEVEVSDGANIREFVYVDARNGNIVNQITGIHEALSINVYNFGYGPGFLVWSTGDPYPFVPNPADPQLEEDINNLIDGTTESYYLFFNSFGFDSYDNAGHVMETVNNDPTINCPNANWNGTSTNYCSGVTGDDTVAHEWGHAYMDYTANLIYQWQSGALNESFSDIWGEVVDFQNGRGLDAPGGPRTDGSCSIYGIGAPSVDDSYRWLSGEDDPAFGGAIRDMWDPTCYGDPGKVTDTEYWCSTVDGGGVHTNSGVPNHAFALMVDGGAYNGYSDVGIGLTKAAHIHWRAQTAYEGPATNFAGHADALEASCDDLIGVNLEGLSTDAPAGPSGEIITAADCAQVAAINTAVEFRTNPDQCGFTTMLDPNAPALCEGFGAVESIVLEDWESGAVPAGWTVGTRDVANPATFDTPDWAVVGSLPDRAGMAAFVEDNPAYGDCAADTEAGVLFLESPVISIPVTAEVPRVAVDHWVATELGWDGGNIKVSVNGGLWTVVPSSAFDFNPYPGSLNGGGNDNPMGGEEAFTGTDGGTVNGSWGQSQVNLTGIAAAGDSVQIRFEMGLDGCNGVVGWYVDEVQVYSCELENPGANCGNSVLDAGETCDDGNNLPGDGCSDICVVEDGWSCTDPVPGDPNGANVVADWSFEGGVPNADWTPFTTLSTTITDFPFCGAGNGCPAAGVANTGGWAIWIGGVSTGVTSSVEQSVVIPSTATDLTLWNLRGVCDDPSDTLHVSLDGTDIGTIACDAVEGDFLQYTFPVAGFNDDAAHNLNIGGTVGGTNGTHSNFFVDDIVISDNVPSEDTPSVCTPIPTEPFACNSGGEGFDSGIPGDWTVVDNEGGGVVWTDMVSSGVGGNFTGGAGDAASVNSDANQFVEFDTELRSPVFSLAAATGASLDYLVNYQNLAGLDFLDVDISADGGATWTNLLSWNEDHGGLFSLPGEAVSIDMSAYVGMDNLMLRWRYYDPNVGDWDWYAQVDDVALNCEIPSSLVCNGDPVDFEGGFPADWSVIDNEGFGLVWTDLASSGIGGNFTGGAGDAASVNSDANQFVEFDTELRSAPFDIPAGQVAAVNYLVNYQNLAGLDFLDLDISSDDGATWTTLLSWNEDHGGLFALPGEAVSIDLSAYAGMNGLMLRWHYYDPNVGDWDWYAQVDDVGISCEDAAAPIIDVDPASLASTLPPNASDVQTLNIGNLGDADLDWYIEEAEAGAPAANTPGFSSGSVERLGTAATASAKAVQDALAPNPGVDVVTDGGFEAGPFGGTWNEFSLNFGTPICDVAGCGTGTGTGPNSGTYWTWFGGIATYEEGAVAQDVTIPASGAATLSFYLEQIACDSAADYMEVTLDGTQVFYTDGASPICGTLGYALQTVDVSAYADGGLHTLEFHSEVFGTNLGVTNFFVDDVMLDADDVPPTGCAAPTDLPWVSVAPDNGTVLPLDTQAVDVTFDSTGMAPGVYEGVLCVNSNDPVTPLVEVPVEMTVEVSDVLYLSSNSAGIAGGVEYKDEDIVAYDVATGDYAMHFDGSDLGLKGADIDALYIKDDGSILMSFGQRFNIPGLGKVDDSDIVKFVPTSVGEDTAGSFVLYHDGSDVGLTKAGEDTDAIGFTPDGRLIVSTNAAFNVPQTGGGVVQGTDDDLLVFNGTGGANAVGDFEMYFDGSDVWNFTEDVWGVWADAGTGDIYFSLQNAFTAGGVSGDELDVFICHPVSLGADTDCNFEMYFDGSAEGFGGDRIDGFAISR